MKLHKRKRLAGKGFWDTLGNIASVALPIAALALGRRRKRTTNRGGRRRRITRASI